MIAKPIRKGRQKRYKEIYDKYKRFLIEKQNKNKIPSYLSATYTIYDDHSNDTSSETIGNAYTPIYQETEFTKKEIRILKNIYHIILND
jgi:hypothetical protein